MLLGPYIDRKHLAIRVLILTTSGLAQPLQGVDLVPHCFVGIGILFDLLLDMLVEMLVVVG